MQHAKVQNQQRIKCENILQTIRVSVSYQLSLSGPAVSFYKIIIIIIPRTMFIVLSSWQSHCDNSLGSRDEYRTVPSD